MEGLKPCPFCGSEKAELITGIEDGRIVYGAWCSQCCASTGRRFANADEAVESWNRRAKRTCRMVDCSTHDTCVVNRELGNGDVMSMEFGYKQCSECGAYVFDCPTVLYCPSCGATVVDE